MSSGAPHILLAGEGLYDALPLVESLQKWGFELHVATSYQEAREVLEQFDCELVLSKMRLRDASAFPLINLLAGSPTTLYFFLPVHRSCWWLPAIRQGQNCWGAPAIRPGEFTRVLEKILQGMKQESTPPLAAEICQKPGAADPAVSLTTGDATKLWSSKRQPQLYPMRRSANSPGGTWWLATRDFLATWRPVAAPVE